MPETILKFWGVRGSIPTPGPENIGFGGNTACIEIRSQADTLIVDAGTGVRSLGLCMGDRQRNAHLKLHFLLTHFHWDHVQGLPFFAPLYEAGNEVAFYSGCRAEELRGILEGQMASPYFPVPFEFLPAKRDFVEMNRSGQPAASAIVHPFPLHHPQQATGFRIELNGSVITHASDFEHGNAKLDCILQEYARGADVLICDAQYTPEEYERHKGWGHSTWLEAARIANQCDVGRLILFHHDPSHDDDCLKRIEAEARLRFPNTDVAREGWELAL